MVIDFDLDKEKNIGIADFISPLLFGDKYFTQV